MSFDRDTAAERAREDLAMRTGVAVDDVTVLEIVDTEFPDASLGAPENGEMSAMMISSGWRITFSADGKKYEYRADKYQLRLHNFDGENIVVVE